MPHASSLTVRTLYRDFEAVLRSVLLTQHASSLKPPKLPKSHRVVIS